MVEVFKTKYGCVYQCDDQNCFWVDFAGSLTSFNFHCFFRLKQLVDQIDIEAMVNNPNKDADLEIISPCSCERCYTLTLPEIIRFKSLLNGAKVMLELNSIIHERLKIVCI
jgi:hypothetical protein